MITARSRLVRFVCSCLSSYFGKKKIPLGSVVPLFDHSIQGALLQIVDTYGKSASHLPLASEGRLEQSLGLHQLTVHGVHLVLGQAVSLKNFVLDLLVLLDGYVDVTELHVISLHGLLALVVSLVGVGEGNLHLIDVNLVLLLDPQSLSLALASASREACMDSRARWWFTCCARTPSPCT